MLIPRNPSQCPVPAPFGGMGKAPGGREARFAAPAYGAAVRRHWWKGVLFVAAGAGLSLFVSLRLQPMYETTAVVEADYQQPSGVIGKDAERPFPSNDSDEFLGTQVKLAQSDNVLRPVALKHRLLVVEGQIKGIDAAADERVRNAPIVLKRLKVARQPSTRLLMVTYRAPSPELAAEAANDIARSYVQRVFQLRSDSSAAMSRFMEGELQELKNKMERSNQRLSEAEREMGMINPEQRSTVLSARLLQLNTEYTTAQAERQAKQASWKAMKAGTFEAAQVSTQGESIGKVNERLMAAKAILASVRSVYGENHPEHRRAQSQVDELAAQMEQAKDNAARRIETDYQQSVDREQMLGQSIAETKADFDKANSHLFAYQQLKREADDDRTMYGDLLRKVRESGVNAGFQNHNIRIADYARPPSKPVTPNIPLNVAAAALVFSFVGLAVMIGIGSLDNKLRNAAQTSRRLNISVLGALPAVKKLSSGRSRDQRPLLLRPDTVDSRPEIAVYHESVRKLRNALAVARDFGSVRSILITSAMPGEGKTVTAADLALCYARQDRSVLLIDADLRRPALHRRFDIESPAGLSDVLCAGVDWETAVVRCPGVDRLGIMTAGNYSAPATDTFGAALRVLLQRLDPEFDLIIVDAPPMLPFAEPLQIASMVDGVVVVVRAGKTSVAAAESVLSTLAFAGAHVLGVVLNQARGGEAGALYYGKTDGYARPENLAVARAGREFPAEAQR